MGFNAYDNDLEELRRKKAVRESRMRPGGQLPLSLVKRIHEATESWLALHSIWNLVGLTPKDGVNLDLLSAEDRLLRAVGQLLRDEYRRD